MRRNGAKSWLDFWNGDTAIYACDRHRELHYEGVARDLSAHVASADALVLDYGCGEALFAARLARECGTLLLYDAAPHVREKLRARFGNEGRIQILEEGTLGAVADASLDLVVANSLIQYLEPGQFSGLLDLWRAKLKAGGRLLLADIPTPRSNPLTDAAALLRFGWRGGFLGAASASLARLYFSDYRRLRRELGFFRYGAEELEGLLRRRGYSARRLPRNVGHNQSRLCLIARVDD
jgi:SAM-dependent methyltransferase